MLRCNFTLLAPGAGVHFPLQYLKKFTSSSLPSINIRFSLTILLKFPLVVWVFLVLFKIRDSVCLFSNTPGIPLGVPLYWSKRQVLFILFHSLLCSIPVCIPHHRNNSQSDYGKVFVYLTVSCIIIPSWNPLFVLAAWKRCITNVNVCWPACLLTHHVTAQNSLPFCLSTSSWQKETNAKVLAVKMQ